LVEEEGIVVTKKDGPNEGRLRGDIVVNDVGRSEGWFDEEKDGKGVGE